LISGKRKAIDGVFVKANASMSSLVERGIMDDAANYGKQLDNNNDQDSAQEMANEKATPKPRKNAKINKKANNKVYSPSDPDARLSVNPEK
jgi:vancomycin resistance protein YoaR